jgi:hypothetical protein
MECLREQFCSSLQFGVGGKLQLSFIEEVEIRCFQNKVEAGRFRSLLLESNGSLLYSSALRQPQVYCFTRASGETATRPGTPRVAKEENFRGFTGSGVKFSISQKVTESAQKKVHSFPALA